MDLDGALELVTKICRSFKGTGEDHDLIRMALTIITRECKNEEATGTCTIDTGSDDSTTVGGGEHDNDDA